MRESLLHVQRGGLGLAATMVFIHTPVASLFSTTVVIFV